MKHKLSVVVIIAVICGTCVYASGLDDVVQTKLFGENQTNSDEYMDEFRSENSERENVVSEAIENAIDQELLNETSDKYSELLIALDALVSDPMVHNDILVNYEYLREVHNLFDSDMEYIADLIISGCDPTEIINLTYFWLDTNEDISLVKSMYDLKGEYEGKKNWYGNAYDRVTDCKNGSLTVDEVQEYMKNGVSDENILFADKLSRKGVYTINQILDKHCSGISMAEIAAEIMSGGVMTADLSEYELISDPSIIMDLGEISSLMGQSQGDDLNSSLSGEEAEDYLDEARSKKRMEILEELNARGVTKDETEVIE